MDRPKANAIDAATSRELGMTFASFRDDASLRVALVTGAGEKFFSAGWDLGSASEGEAPDADFGAGGFGGLQELPGLNKPVVAAVNGIACAGGLELMISADLILAAQHARFALPEVNVGVTAEAATIKLRRRIPYHIACDLLLTGRWMDADEAKHWGLVNEVLPADRLLTRARALCDQLASGPPLLHAAVKDMLRQTETLPEQDAFAAARNLPSVQRVFRSEDVKEGARAFLEKRTPEWRGR